jgi:polysaccharide biosynthesis protein PelC
MSAVRPGSIVRATSVAALLMLAGCSVRHVHRGEPLAQTQKWVILPVQNYAETPMAGERAEAILANLLRIRGVRELDRYPAPAMAADLPELDERRRFDSALGWARSQGFAYGVTGSVHEWRYRTGLDGEPAVGLGIEVIELASGRVVWSASGALSGWSRETVSGTAERLLGRLVSQLELR